MKLTRKMFEKDILPKVVPFAKENKMLPSQALLHHISQFENVKLKEVGSYTLLDYIDFGNGKKLFQWQIKY